MNPIDSINPQARSTGMALTRKAWIRTGLTFLVLGLLALPTSTWIDSQDWWVHGAWCALGLLIAIAVLLRALRRDFQMALRDHLVMFTAAFAFYFLFGASLLSFGSEEEIARSLNYYFIDARAGLQVDAVNGIGFGIALITSAISPRRWFERHTARVASVASNVSPPLVMFLLIIFGSGAMLNALSVDFGFRDGVVGGVWRAASLFSTVAVFLGAAYRGKFARTMRVAAILLALTSAVAGLLLFNKTQVLISLGALITGLAMRYRAPLIFPVGLVGLALVYLAIGGVVSYGRGQLGEESTTALSVRWRIAMDGFTARFAGDDRAQTTPWGRLCYVPSQGAAMDFFDADAGGDEIRLIPWLFVPRFIAPDKPIITQSGADFHEKITGHKGSSTGQGIFSSGYYNAGWLGVILASVICGWILAQTSAAANAILSQRAMLMLPLGLLGYTSRSASTDISCADYVGILSS